MHANTHIYQGLEFSNIHANAKCCLIDNLRRKCIVLSVTVLLSIKVCTRNATGGDLSFALYLSKHSIIAFQ